MTRPLVALQFLFLSLAGISWITLPIETIPSLAWRGHYGAIFLMCGISTGIAIGALWKRF